MIVEDTLYIQVVELDASCNPEKTTTYGAVRSDSDPYLADRIEEVLVQTYPGARVRQVAGKHLGPAEAARAEEEAASPVARDIRRHAEGRR